MLRTFSYKSLFPLLFLFLPLSSTYTHTHRVGESGGGVDRGKPKIKIQVMTPTLVGQTALSPGSYIAALRGRTFEVSLWEAQGNSRSVLSEELLSPFICFSQPASFYF